MPKIKFLVLLFFFLIKGILSFSQSYTSIASGSWSDPAVWSLPWVGAPVPPAGSQYVIISAGTTISGSTSNTYTLDVQGTLILNGNYNNGAGGLTIENGGTMIINGDLNTTSALVINGNGKLYVSGNLNENGGSIALNSNSILVVGGNFTEGWQTTNLYGTATILINGNYQVNGDLNEYGTNEIAVLGTVSGGGCSGCTSTIAANDPAWIFYTTGNPNLWTGTSSTSWGNSANWTKQVIPATTECVGFATISNCGINASQDLSLDVDRTIGYLTNFSSKKLIIPAGLCLTVTGTITTNNDPNQIYIKSSSTGTANGSLKYHNAASAPVYATVEMYSLAAYDGAHYKWQYFGVPLPSIVANPTFAGSYIRKFEESGNTTATRWVTQNNSSILTAFSGYEITQTSATTLVFQGQLTNSDKTLNLSYTTGSSYPGQNIFANPYTAAIDIKALNFSGNADASVYLYNTGSLNDWTTNMGGTTAGLLAGQYLSVPLVNAGLYSLPQYIPSMQGFLVKTPVAGETLQINYNLAIAKNANPMRAKATIEQPSDSTDNIGTVISVNGSRFGDKMWLLTNPRCSHGFDNGFDGEKFIGSVLAPQIYASEKDGIYQVNTVDDINETVLGFQPGEDVDYTMSFTHYNSLRKYAGVYLMDVVENKIIDVSENGASYKFQALPNDSATNRFKIITRSYEKKASDADTQIKVFNSYNSIIIQNLGSQSGEFAIYDVLGKFILKGQFGAHEIKSIPVGQLTGVYVVNASTSTERVGKRIIMNYRP